MKSNYKKIGFIFSLLFILMISLAVVSADELESSDSLSDDMDSQVPELVITPSPAPTGGHPDSVNIGGSNVYPGGSYYSGNNHDESIQHSSGSNGNQAIFIVGGGNNNIENNVISVSSGGQAISTDHSENNNIGNNIISGSSGSIGDSNSLNAAYEEHDYSISVKNISATENTNVNIVATVKDNGASVTSGYVGFILWMESDEAIMDGAEVNDGQAILTIKLPSASKVSGLNWLCHAYYYSLDDLENYQVETTFKVLIKRAVNPTTIIVADTIGKMGKKVTLVANVKDIDGSKVTSGKVTFTVNGKSYTVNVKNGKASKTINTPFLGIYTVKVNYKGVGAYKASSAKFKLVSDLKASIGYYKLLTVKKGAKKYYKITLTNDYTKKPLKSFKVKFKVKTKKTWKTYTLKSNSKGVIKWSTKKLSVGTHAIKISSAYKYFKINIKGKIVVKKK